MKHLTLIESLRRHAYRALLLTTYERDALDDILDEIAQVNAMSVIELIDCIAQWDDNFVPATNDEPLEYRRRLKIVASMHDYPITDKEIADLDDATFH